MTDQEFLQAIENRIRTNGWQRGRIGHYDGCNCLLGAAGYVVHGETLKVSEDGINPLEVDGELIEDGYDEVPGMVRLAKLLGYQTADPVGRLNDTSTDGEHALSRMRERLDG